MAFFLKKNKKIIYKLALRRTFFHLEIDKLATKITVVV